MRGSTVLEQIDISLVGKHEEPEIKPVPKISPEAVVPILDSIISTNGCSFKHIQCPVKWWRGFWDDNASQGFKDRYNRYMNELGLICVECNTRARNRNEEWLSYCLENRKAVCYECFDPICKNCARFDDRAVFCGHCRKNYCAGCAPTSMRCSECGVAKCRGCLSSCGDMKVCDDCEASCCDNCILACAGCNGTRCFDCRPYFRCGGDDCEKANCVNCYDGEEYDVKPCTKCNENYCSDCKFKKVKNGEYDCLKCSGAIFHIVLEENAKLTKENEELWPKTTKN